MAALAVLALMFARHGARARSRCEAQGLVREYVSKRRRSGGEGTKRERAVGKNWHRAGAGSERLGAQSAQGWPASRSTPRNEYLDLDE